MDDAETDLPELIERISSVLAAATRTHWDTLDLHPVHGRILVYLANANRYSDTVMAVVDYLGATKGTVSQSIDHLVERGLVERQRDERDLRVTHLRLSSAGRRVLSEAHPPPVWRKAMSDADPSISAGLVAILGRLQRAGGRRSFGVCQSCRHHLVEGDGRFRCGLTREPLSAADRLRWCREHELEAAT